MDRIRLELEDRRVLDVRRSSEDVPTVGLIGQVARGTYDGHANVDLPPAEFDELMNLVFYKIDREIAHLQTGGLVPLPYDDPAR